MIEAVLNQHSFLIVGLLLLGGLWFVVRRGSRWLRRIVLLGTVALLVSLVLALRPGVGDIRSPGDLDRALARGQPVALEFYSNW